MKIKGVTLVELLISMLIVSIMIGGIFAANHAIQSIDKSQTYRSTLFIQTQVTLDTIRNDAAHAVGTANDVGVCINNTADDTNYFCFRREGSPRTWACYTRYKNASGNRVNLGRCTFASGGVSCGTDPTACPNCGQASCLQFGAYTYVGTMTEDVFTSPQNPPNFTSLGFSMKVINREDPAAAKSPTNPEVILEVTTYPEEHSW
ncbi:MAG: prepilin-type N-terminal cleavage/methylation domain-containing protein [Candidatus Omnitrophica bacterium]|nr:prepilin-type N-terminal cleavage/methylation domain-containing protein [Candidatus Omnitrophota bacterium]